MSFAGFLLKRFRGWLAQQRATHDLLRRCPGLVIEPGVVLRNAPAISFGPGSSVQHGTLLHAGGLAWTDGKGHIRGGSNVEVSPGCVLFGGGGIDLGDGVKVGSHVLMFSTEEDINLGRPEDQPTHFLKPIVLEAGAIVASMSVVLPGVRMGKHSIAAAGSVLLKDVPPYAIVAGIPAKIIGDRRQGVQGRRLATAERAGHGQSAAPAKPHRPADRAAPDE